MARRINNTYNDMETYTEAEMEANRDFNWWPLLLIPLAFFIGWGTNESLDRDNGVQYGVGGGPITPCPDPNDMSP